MKRLLHLPLILLVLTALGSAQLAPTPPMGWNSWDSYGLTITEQQFRDNVAMLRDQLKPFGWNYAVIDEGWFFANPGDRSTPEKLQYQVDAFGRYVPVPARFPSSAGGGTTSQDGHSVIDPQSHGFVELGRWVHAQGLRFGIHIVRGIPRESVRRNTAVEGSPFHAQDLADQADACPWDPTNWGIKDTPAGQAWYDSLLRQYAAWGIDMIKVDCIADHPYKLSEIRQISLAIQRSGRPMVLSLSPGPTALAHAAEVGSLAQMWRISDDGWDYWDRAKPGYPETVKSQFARLAAWAPYSKPGNWPDADMLPLGRLGPSPGEGTARTTRLTPAEQQTQITLWAIARSPLILGANLTMLDAPTLRLLTNRDLLRLNQTATGSREALHDGDLIAWTADLPAGPGKGTGEHALALFNVGDQPLILPLAATLQKVLPGSNSRMRVLDSWARRKALSLDEALTLPPHGCVLLSLQHR